jgi:hypothetical protein
MSDLMNPHTQNASSPWPRLWLTIPPEIATPDALIMYEVPHPELLDRRLKGYRLTFLISEPPADAPNRSPVVLIPLHGYPVDGWQLWRAWLQWHDAPVIGELRFEPVYGWCSTTYVPQESRRVATPREHERTAYGLRVLQRLVPPRGRRKGQRGKGVGTKYDDLDSFIKGARRQRDHHRQLGQPFTEESLAHELGLVRRTFQRGLTRCGLTWDAFCDEPTPPCDKKC